MACAACGWTSAPPAFLVEAAEERRVDRLRLSIGERSQALKVGGRHNAYNAAAAIAAASFFGIPPSWSIDALASFAPKFGRAEHLAFDERSFWVFLAKNPVSSVAATRQIVSDPRIRAVVVLVNDLAADGRDVSWIWDAGLEELLGLGVPVLAGGVRAHDIALRFRYAGGAVDVVDPTSIPAAGSPGDHGARRRRRGPRDLHGDAGVPSRRARLETCRRRRRTGAGAAMTDLVIADLYPRLLRTYGDRDNVVVLARRAEWRGFSVRIEEVGQGEPIPTDTSIVVLGGGTDSVQQIVGRDVVRRTEEVRRRGCPRGRRAGRLRRLPAPRSGGTSFRDGCDIQGLGVLDVETRASRDRIVGRVQADARLWGWSLISSGSRITAAATTLGPGAEPLASTRRGHGNNGHDRIEGAAQGSVVGTYLHRPVLALNPELTDAMLARALAPLTGGEELDPLDDVLEHRAHEGLARRVRDDRRPVRRHRVVAAAIAAVIMLAAMGSFAAVERRDGNGAKGWFEPGWMDLAQAGHLASTPVRFTWEVRPGVARTQS